MFDLGTLLVGVLFLALPILTIVIFIPWRSFSKCIEKKMLDDSMERRLKVSII